MFFSVFRDALLGTGLAVWASAAPAPKPLAIVRPTLHQFEGGPVVPSNFVFVPGDALFLSCLIQGYKASEDSRIHLRYQIDALDPAGVRLMETAQREIKTELAPEDKEWMPRIQQSVPVPPLTEPGGFRILVSVRDLLADSETKAEIPFRVGGRQVEPSDTLVVRDFRFLRSEEDRDALATAAYRPGDALWARFEIVGYRYGENNRVHVEYGLSVLGPSGKPLYAEPRAAVEESASFYPKRYLPGSLSLNLQQNARPGDYTIVLSVRDEIGKQTFEARHGFKIE
jgi:hypothetical protein